MDEPPTNLHSDLARHGDVVEGILSGMQWIVLVASLAAPAFAAGLLAPVVTQYGESAVAVFFATFVWSGAILAITVILLRSKISNVWGILGIAAGSFIAAIVIGALIGAPVLQVNNIVIGPIEGSLKATGLLLFYYFFLNIFNAALATFGPLGMILGAVAGVGWGATIAHHLELRESREAARRQEAWEAADRRRKEAKIPPPEGPPRVQF